MAKITFGTANGRKLNKHHIPITSIGTFSVNGRQVTGCVPLTRGDKIKGNYSQFSRLAPLIAPTFGSFSVKTMAFFVPAHTVWRGYRSWVSGSVDSSVPNAPLNFSLEDLVYLVTASANPAGSSSWVSEFIQDSSDVYKSNPSGSDYGALESCDFCVHDVYNGEAHAANFTARGRELWNTLICLGYNFPNYITFSSETQSQVQVDTYFYGDNYSILPFMAYARVCYDYLFPSRYVNQQGFAYLFEQPLNNGWAVQSTRRNYMLKMTRTWFNQYDQDFYTSLWARPNASSVGNGASDLGTVYNQPVGTSSMSVLSNSTPAVAQDAYVTHSANYMTTTLTASSLRWLTAVADFALRNNIGGARFREFMKAHFGYNTDNDVCDESVFIKMFSDEVRIQDVTNTTSGSGMGALGELAGKGYSSADDKKDYSISYEAKEAGFLLFVTECKPNVGYYQGNRPWARKLVDRFQLYTPEFDGVGMEGVPVQSVMSSYSDHTEVDACARSRYNDAYGFAPRYSERYKVGHDNLFGDFRFRSRGATNLGSWHTMRNVLYGRDSLNPLALDAQFLSVDNQYQRIFRYVGQPSQGVVYDVEDKIWSFLVFDLTKYSTAKSLGNSLPFFEENGREAHMNYEGSDIK